MSYPIAKPDGKDARELVRVLNQAVQGKLNATLDVSLATSTTRTTVTDARISIDSWIDFSPSNATAAASRTSIYRLSQTSGSAVLAHDSTTATRTGRLLIIG